jgi:WD40-like Beta Propeller Repeat
VFLKILRLIILIRILRDLSRKFFAPGFISTDKKELNSVFTPDGKEFYFSIETPSKGYKIYVTIKKETSWTKPEPVSFSSKFSDVDMCITHDGKRMYFCSTRPVKNSSSSNLQIWKIWYVDRINNGWSDAKYLNSAINSGERALYPTVSLKGTMYFQAIFDDTFGSKDIYYSVLDSGKYSYPIHLNESINSTQSEGDVLIAPDESYLIVDCNGRSDSQGGADLYISFRKKDGSWTKLKNMGPEINSAASDYCPMLSPDSKYFFFTSTRSGNGDIYWVSAQIIEELKPLELLKKK